MPTSRWDALLRRGPTSRFGRVAIFLAGMLVACVPPEGESPAPGHGLQDAASPSPSPDYPYVPCADWDQAMTDQDGDGYAPCTLSDRAADCNDQDPLIHPGASEVCDSLQTDEDCDGLTDDGDGSVDPATYGSFYPDSDGDQFGDADALSASQYPQGLRQCDPPQGWASASGDCDDTAASVFPGANEVCDDIDQNCDGDIDETFDVDGDGSSACSATPDCSDADADVYPGLDADGDGFDACGSDTQPADCDDADALVFPDADADGDGYRRCPTDDSAEDCADGDPQIHPGATEICDPTKVDQDCDKKADDDDASVDPSSQVLAFPDLDFDTYGDALSTTSFRYCHPPEGWAERHDDCDDQDPDIHPDAAETCDAIDEDCDGLAGIDADADGYQADCESSPVTDSDCDDAEPLIHPGSTESCNTRDDDCDGAVDEALTTDYCVDTDNDDYCGLNDSGAYTVEAKCEAPFTGYQPLSDATTPDCDDQNAEAFPGALETCDRIDQNCDGVIDDGFDRDGDGSARCDTENGAPDCDDTNAQVSPNLPEDCFDGQDNDCNSLADAEDTACASNPPCPDDVDPEDHDADGFFHCVAADSEAPSDCDDHNPLIHPDAEEVCDSAQLDEDCDGLADDADDSAILKTSYFPDEDRDGYGDDTGTAFDFCVAPSGWTSLTQDCDDQDPLIHPSAAETCDTIDQNCDGLAAPDEDQDGVAASCSEAGVVLPDCSDTDAQIYPGALERCNGLDDDCDSVGEQLLDYCTDEDSDGFCPVNSSDVYLVISVLACEEPPLGLILLDTKSEPDCNDTEQSIFPGAPEFCDGIDQDCNGTADDQLDYDQDGFSRCTSSSSVSPDCNDYDAQIYPGASEVCNFVDDDCDRSIDNGFDDDLDGVTTCSGDCDDDNADRSPTQVEDCRDDEDNDCDRMEDSDDPDCVP